MEQIYCISLKYCNESNGTNLYSLFKIFQINRGGQFYY